MGRIVNNMINGEESESGAAPADLSSKQISMAPPVLADYVGIGEKYGDVVTQPAATYSLGSGDVVSVVFRSANPRNNQRLDDTFLTVEVMNEEGEFTAVYVDGDWCTKFMWEGGVGHAGRSKATVEWHLGWLIQDNPNVVVGGTYRICHFGQSTSLIGKDKEFSGCSNSFVVNV